MPVGAVQADIADADARGGGNAEAGKVVADIGRTGDFCFHLDAGRLGGVGEDGAQRGVLGEGVGGPVSVDLDERLMVSAPIAARNSLLSQ